jgi:hypothetical protein
MVYKVQHEDTLNLEKPTGFCSMTFLINGTETCGLTGSLQNTFGSAEG